MKTHKDLEVWNKAIANVTSIYLVTRSFPGEETYGLSSQLRRAAVSIPSNIAEGAGRQHKKESIQFFYIALGSAMEVETQIIIAHNLAYIDTPTKEELIAQIHSIAKMINGLINHIKRNFYKP